MLNTLWFSVICGQTYAHVPVALIQHLVRRLAIQSKIDKMGEGVIFITFSIQITLSMSVISPLLSLYMRYESQIPLTFDSGVMLHTIFLG